MWQGSLVALVTPMLADESVDYPSLDKLLELHLTAGTDGLVILGSTGEGSMLTVDERLQFTRHVVEAIDGRMPVIVGVGTNSTKQSVTAALQMAELGVDGLLMIAPYYNCPTQEGVYQHFKTIAENVSAPIILYNHPGRTGTDILPETVARLASLNNIVGLKEAVVDKQRFVALQALVADDFALYSGDDESFVEFFKHGATGVISVVANIIPEAIQAIAMAALREDWDLAEDLLVQHMPLIGAMNFECNPIPVKYACHLMGFCEESIRLPLLSPSTPVQKKLIKLMRSYDLLSKESEYVETA